MSAERRSRAAYMICDTGPCFSCRSTKFAGNFIITRFVYSARFTKQAWPSISHENGAPTKTWFIARKWKKLGIPAFSSILASLHAASAYPLTLHSIVGNLSMPQSYWIERPRLRRSFSIKLAWPFLPSFSHLARSVDRRNTKAFFFVQEWLFYRTAQPKN
jgi:hypothetical protein